MSLDASTPISSCEVQTPRDLRGAPRWRPMGLIIIAAALGTGIQMKFPFLNGPAYWDWSWQQIPPWKLFAVAALATIPMVVGLAGFEMGRWSTRAALAWIVVGTIGLTLAISFLQIKPGGLNRTARIIGSPGAFSYFTDAAHLFSGDHPQSLREVLSHYKEISPTLNVHSQTKPPGPVLYMAAFIKVLGSGRETAIVIGLIYGVLAALGVPATFLFIDLLVGNKRAAMYGAVFLALCPGLMFFYPGFDAPYILFTCAMLGLWVMAIRSGSAKYAVACGVVLAVALLFSYVFLVLGAWMAGYAIYARMKREGEVTWRGLGYKCACALAAAGVFYALLWLISGFHPIATFRQAVMSQKVLLKWLKRPYPASAFYDLQDFDLGAGWLGYVLILMYFFRRHSKDGSKGLGVAILCVMQFVLVAATGLIQAETARVWAFMLPLVALPVGMELAKWDRVGRAAALVCVWVLLIITAERMLFISVEPWSPWGAK